MQFVKPVNDQSWWILDQIFPGRADFLIKKTEHDRMEAVASYLAQQIKVKTEPELKILFKIITQNFRMRNADCLQMPIPCDPIALQ